MSLVTRKPVYRGVRPCKTQSGLLSYRIWLESWNFGFKQVYVLFYLSSEQRRYWADCVDACRLSATLLFAYGVRQVFSRRGSYDKSALRWNYSHTSFLYIPFWMRTGLFVTKIFYPHVLSAFFCWDFSCKKQFSPDGNRVFVLRAMPY